MRGEGWYRSESTQKNALTMKSRTKNVFHDLIGSIIGPKVKSAPISFTILIFFLKKKFNAFYIHSKKIITTLKINPSYNSCIYIFNCQLNMYCAMGGWRIQNYKFLLNPIVLLTPLWKRYYSNTVWKYGISQLLSFELGM